jgi:hypothetical protein
MGEQPGAITITPPTEPLVLDRFVVRLPSEDDIDALVCFGDDPDTAEAASSSASCSFARVMMRRSRSLTARPRNTAVAGSPRAWSGA